MPITDIDQIGIEELYYVYLNSPNGQEWMSSKTLLCHALKIDQLNFKKMVVRIIGD